MLLLTALPAPAAAAFAALVAGALTRFSLPALGVALPILPRALLHVLVLVLPVPVPVPVPLPLPVLLPLPLPTQGLNFTFACKA